MKPETFLAIMGLSLIKNLTLFFLTIFLIFLDILNKFWLDVFFNRNWKNLTLLVFNTWCSSL